MNLNEVRSIECPTCKEKVLVNFYYSGARITEEQDAFNGYRNYQATVNARAICPFCGNEIIRIYHHEITPTLIARLALGEKEDE